MNRNLKFIIDASEMMKKSAAIHCRAYCELCGTNCGDAVLSVLDGELRMSEQINKLKDFYSSEINIMPVSNNDISEFTNNQN